MTQPTDPSSSPAPTASTSTAANAFKPKGEAPAAGAGEKPATRDDEVATLKAQLAGLQAKIDKLSS